MPRRLLRILTLGAIAGLIVVPLNPVHSTALKLAFLGCVLAAWIGLTLLVWKRKPLRTAALLLPVLLASPMLLPGARIDPAELRKDYVRRMTGYEGTRYYWGGENFRGIDCSGLPRRAYRDALLAHGLRHLNGRAFRAYAEQWWFDASAKALGQGYRGYTTLLPLAGTIRHHALRNIASRRPRHHRKRHPRPRLRRRWTMDPGGPRPRSRRHPPRPLLRQRLVRRQSHHPPLETPR